MRRRRGPVQETESADVDGALEVLEAEDLRELIRDLLGGLDAGERGRVVDRLVARAAGKGGGWVPAGPSEDAVAEILSFAEAARRAGYAEPYAVDAHLRRGSEAFYRRDYETARRIFAALLAPISSADLYVGQDEMVDEVLSVDVGACAAQYAVSVYMTSDTEHRAEAVRAAIGEVGDLAFFRNPIAEMERVAVEPLPELDDFLPRWRTHVEQEGAGAQRRGGWLSDEERWLREVVQRLEGTGGLAALARTTRHGDDLLEWCRALVEARDWKAALSAFEEAAEIVRDGANWRGEFLDGAALAAQELGRRDLPRRLERAWRDSPSMLRLRCWLGSGRTKARVRKLAAEALAACPEREVCQRAVLHLVLGDHESAAQLLAAAPGLGWSGSEHPGHLLVSLFPGLLEGRSTDSFAAGTAPATGYLDLDELEWSTTDPDEPRLRAVEIVRILALAGAQGPIRGKARTAVLAALRKAAEKRVEGVTRKQRRRYYDHAAELVATCAALDPTAETGRWVARLRKKYSRYPALQGELDESLGKA